MFPVILAILILSIQFLDEFKASADEFSSTGNPWIAQPEELTTRMKYSPTDTAKKRPNRNISESIKRFLSAKHFTSKRGQDEDEYTEYISDYGTNDPDVEIPPEFDARIKWKKCASIAHIYNQGNCDAPWAIGVVSAFTDRICIRSGGRITALRSSRQVMSCCKRCGSFHETSSYSLREAWFFLRSEGVVTGGNYNSNQGCQPYKMQPCAVNEGAQPSSKAILPLCSSLPFVEPKCDMSCDTNRISFNDDKIKVNQVYKLMTEHTVQIHLLQHGPVAHKMVLYENFYSYKSGVYKEPRGEKIGDHVVRVIGWGTEGNQPYWLITGSFGTGWGDNGIGKIQRNDIMYHGTFYCGKVDL